MTNPDINLTPTAALLEIKNKIPCRTWGIPSESNAAFLLIHGLGGHSGWFEPLGRRLKIKQIFALAPDLAGFGKRQNEQYISYQAWIKDIAAAFNYLRQNMGNKPIFLIGNSMGGLLALESCKTISPTGLVLLSPAFAGHPKLFPLFYQIRELVKVLIAPHKDFDVPYDANLITKQEQVRAWINNDQGTRLSVPGKLLLDLVFLTKGIRFRKINLHCPLFMITAGVDAIVDNRASELIYRQIQSPNKKKTIMPKAMHDLLIDPALEQVSELLIDWANKVVQTNERKIGSSSYN